MGKLSKSLGLDKKGAIAVALDKRTFYSGDVASGTIHVTVRQPIQCDALVIKFSGKEWISWTEQQQNDKQQRSKKVKVYSEKVVIHTFAQVLAPGEYSFPFTYRIPAGLPGSFELQDFGSTWIKAVRAGVSYSLKATLDVGGFMARDIKAKLPLSIREPVPDNEPDIKASVTKNVRYMLLASKGECQLSITTDYNAYHPGETAKVRCAVRNTSEVEIRAVRYRLFQDVTLRTGIWNAPLTQTVVTCQFPGVPANQTVVHSHAVPLGGVANFPRPYPTSSRGKLVQCTYRLEVECDIQWCPDVAVKVPLRLF